MRKIHYRLAMTAGFFVASTAAIAVVIAVSTAGATAGKTQMKAWGLINVAQNSTSTTKMD
ncbi:hypothetical protein [Kutzneria buriramensis]|uniref:Uncharacterized protein n=1 Tax=Kutzneria buriramensis TaxID=1045776 RepID=A0A3E0H138_9PSEU|nr:hypothetical protein [Kutzneria buriramensis]REH35760.1 hypothetical protein BCF44_117148 [Kutzneria buriramensis]